MSLKKIKQVIKEDIAGTILRFEDITLSQIQTRELLCSHTMIQNLDEVDTIVLRNLLETFNYLETIDLKTIKIDSELFIQLNHMLAKEQALNAGGYRDNESSIPCILTPIPPPDIADVQAILDDLIHINKENYKDIISDSFMYLAKMQPFYDGNKRSSLVICNIALLQKDLGYFSISEENYSKFEDYLTLFYRDDEMSKLKELIQKELIVVA